MRCVDLMKDTSKVSACLRRTEKAMLRLLDGGGVTQSSKESMSSISGIDKAKNSEFYSSYLKLREGPAECSTQLPTFIHNTFKKSEETHSQ